MKSKNRPARRAPRPRRAPVEVVAEVVEYRADGPAEVIVLLTRAIEATRAELREVTPANHPDAARAEAAVDALLGAAPALARAMYLRDDIVSRVVGCMVRLASEQDESKDADCGCLGSL